jgi:hypothetical protein
MMSRETNQSTKQKQFATQKEQDLQNDPDYQTLLVSYQNCELDTCSAIAEALLEKYPKNDKLLQFRDHIEIQLVISRREARSQTSSRVKRIVFNVITILVILGAIIGIGYGAPKAYQQYINTLEETARQSSELEQERNQAESLERLKDQAETMLQTGNTETAVEIIALIQNLDPEYPGLETLIEDSEHMKSIDATYNEAITLQESGDLKGALEIYQEILDKVSQYRDIQQRMDEIENELYIETLIETAQTAYAEGNWTAAITEYEALLEILPASSTTTEFKENLFFSYLNTMESMVTSEETTLEQIQQADAFYSRAVSLTPQSKELSDERERLVDLYNQLQIYKFYRMAKDLLAEDIYSEDALGRAATYLGLAVSYDPEDYQKTIELENTSLYRDALLQFNARSFDTAIENLLVLQERESQYDYESRQLLYEAYIGRGNNSISDGANTPARDDYESAEIMAWEDDNLIKIFSVQIKIGHALGKLRAYEDATSYYIYALQSIDYATRAANKPAFVNAIQQALELNQDNQYFQAYTLFSETLTDMDSLFAIEEVEAFKGESLVLYADRYNSTVDLIRVFNDLTPRMTLANNQTLTIPTLP